MGQERVGQPVVEQEVGLQEGEEEESDVDECVEAIVAVISWGERGPGPDFEWDDDLVEEEERMRKRQAERRGTAEERAESREWQGCVCGFSGSGWMIMSVGGGS